MSLAILLRFLCVSLAFSLFFVNSFSALAQEPATNVYADFEYACDGVIAMSGDASVQSGGQTFSRDEIARFHRYTYKDVSAFSGGALLFKDDKGDAFAAAISDDRAIYPKCREMSFAVQKFDKANMRGLQQYLDSSEAYQNGGMTKAGRQYIQDFREKEPAFALIFQKSGNNLSGGYGYDTFVDYILGEVPDGKPILALNELKRNLVASGMPVAASKLSTPEPKKEDVASVKTATSAAMLEPVTTEQELSEAKAALSLAFANNANDLYFAYPGGICKVAVKENSRGRVSYDCIAIEVSASQVQVFGDRSGKVISRESLSLSSLKIESVGYGYSQKSKCVPETRNIYRLQPVPESTKKWRIVHEARNCKALSVTPYSCNVTGCLGYEEKGTASQNFLVVGLDEAKMIFDDGKKDNEAYRSYEEKAGAKSKAINECIQKCLSQTHSFDTLVNSSIQGSCRLACY